MSLLSSLLTITDFSSLFTNRPNNAYLLDRLFDQDSNENVNLLKYPKCIPSCTKQNLL